MTKTFSICWAIVATFTLYVTSASAEKAADKPAAAPAAAGAPPAGGPPPGPPKPGEEMKKLQPVIANYTWNDGKVAAGAMGPGSPEMTSHGKQTCHTIMGGLWAMCDLEDVAGAGKQSTKWQGHLIMGWDVERKEYIGVGVDNMGSAMKMKGKLDGTKFVWDTDGEATMMGQPIKFRITYDFTDPKAVKFTDERSTKGAPFAVGETATFKPAK